MENQQLAVLLLTKLCTLLIGCKKQKVLVLNSELRSISSRELAGLHFLGGFILHNLYSGLRKSSHWKSDESQNIMAILKSLQDTKKPNNQKLVSALDRNGLWYITESFQEILVIAEKHFCFEISNRENVKKIEHENIVQRLMNIPEIVEHFQSSVEICDEEFNGSCIKNTLQSILKLFVRVRSFNFAKDTVQKYRLKNVVDKKSLRKTLNKNTSEDHDFNI